MASSELTGVFIVFNGRIISGARASKLYTLKYDAFRSINTTDVGYVEGDGINFTFVPPINDGSDPELDDTLETDVYLLKLIPGTKPEVFDFVIELGYKGVIIETFGLGGIPYLGRNLLPGIEKLISKGIAVVATTQCTFDGTDLNVYDLGVKALKIGVIPARDMAKEAVVVKLMWALGHTRDAAEVKRIMLRSCCGELK